MSHIHIPDGVLPLWLWLSGWVLTLALVTLAGHFAEKTGARRKVPLLAVVSALMLVAMSTEIVPIAYHINLTVVAGVLLGPELSVIAAFIVQIVLAMLGHGGVTVLGLNTLLVSSEMIIGWALFRLLVVALSRRRVRWAAAIATVTTLAITTTMLVGIVALAGGSAASRDTGALNPQSMAFANPFGGGVVHVGLFSGGEHPVPNSAEAPVVSVKRFAAVVYTLGSIGWLIEALVTAWILGYIARVRPGLLWQGALLEHGRHLIGDETGQIQ
jgi:cobalt/nickel transport system permease protein